MGDDITARLSEIAKRLECDMQVTAACGLQTAAKLLDAARMDLLCSIHAISGPELQLLVDELNVRNSAGASSIVYLAERKRIRDAGRP
jgi:hypothetical protein